MIHPRTEAGAGETFATEHFWTPQRLKILWSRTGAKGIFAWEPPGGTRHVQIVELVERGFVKIVDGRCMFERIKDSMVKFTDAGRLALQGPTQ